MRKRDWHPRWAATFAALSLSVAALMVAGCGGGNEEKEAGAPTGPAVATVDVKETEFKLEPANPKISKRGVIVFRVTNDGKVDHNLEVEGPSGEVELPENIKPGRSATLKVNLDEAGKYEWYCPVDNHKQLGMRGEITVAGGDAAAPPGGGGGGY